MLTILPVLALCSEGVASPLLTEVWDSQDTRGFGESVSPAGDINGDGYNDVLVGSPFYDDSGRVYLYAGGENGLLPAVPVELGSMNAEFGRAVQPAGDLNGDGFDDVAIGSPQYTGPEVREGRVDVFFGSATGLGVESGWSVDANVAYSALGWSIGAGDLNGDGFSDLIVGAPGIWDATETRVDVYFGSEAGLSLTPDWNIASESLTLGTGVSSGDVNGDGFDDLVIADSTDATVFLGSHLGPSAEADWSLVGEEWGDCFSVNANGDVNGDGYADVLLGGLLGEASLYLGSATGPSTSPAWTVSDPYGADSWFGYSFAAGDLNADGFDDVAVGAEGYNNGRVFVYLGSAAGLSEEEAWWGESDDYGSYYGGAVAITPDVTGNGTDDLMVGAPEYNQTGEYTGHAYVYSADADNDTGVPDTDTDADTDANTDTAANTDGDDSDARAEVPCGCNASAPLGGLWTLGLAAVVARRRRSQAA